MKPKRSQKKVTVELEFVGDGSIARIGTMAFSGGVPPPRSGRSLRFTVDREYLGRDGDWNPRWGTPTVRGGFQVNVRGTSRGYRELGRYFMALAEIDCSNDPDYHEHVNALSADGRTRLHFIFRKRR